MVGRLVEHQDVGLRRQDPGKGSAAGFPTGETRRVFLPGEAEMLQQIGHAIGIVARSQTRLRIGLNRGVASEIRCLFQITDGRGGMAEDLARLGLDEAGRDLHQRRLAGTVAADKADAVARLDLQAGTRQQRCAAEGEMDVVEFQNGRCQGIRLRKDRRGGQAASPDRGSGKPRSVLLRCSISFAKSRRAS